MTTFPRAYLQVPAARLPSDDDKRADQFEFGLDLLLEASRGFGKTA